MKQIFRTLTTLVAMTLMAFSAPTTIIDGGIGSDLEKFEQTLTQKKLDLNITNERIQEISTIVTHSKEQITRYKTATQARINAEAACRNQREQSKIQGLWHEPLAQEKSEKCFKELREDIPVYKKIVKYASDLLNSMEKLRTEAQILGLDLPAINATIIRLKADIELEKNK